MVDCSLTKVVEIMDLNVTLERLVVMEKCASNLELQFDDMVSGCAFKMSSYWFPKH